jgi:hypothetical protein
MNLTFQVTIPAGGVVNVQEAVFGANPTNIERNVYMQWLTFQNNSAHPCRYGTSAKVSVTTPAAVNGGTAGFGILLSNGGGSGSQSTPVTYSTMLSEWWIAGTPGDVIDGMCLQ